MSKDELKALIEETIYDNVEGDITGSKLAGILEAIVDSVPEGPSFYEVMSAGPGALSVKDADKPLIKDDIDNKRQIILFNQQNTFTVICATNSVSTYYLYVYYSGSIITITI